MSPGTEILALVLAAGLGGAVGAQRQAAHKPAGFRTHLIVALGSCAFMELSRIAGDTRIAAGVITGIGFLGAGAIVRDGVVPRGLTTAASIWSAAAIGLALGFGTRDSAAVALATTLLVIAALVLSDSWLERLFPQPSSLDVTVTFDLEAISLDGVAELFAAHHVPVKRSDRLAIRREGEHRHATWHLKLVTEHDRRLRSALVEIAREPAIEQVETESSARS